MVLDSVRTLFIWLITLFLAWQDFQILQLVGFVILLSGMCLYNNIIIVPAFRYCQERRRAGRHMTQVGGEHDRLINDTASGLWRFMCDLTCLNGVYKSFLPFLSHTKNIRGIFSASEVRLL